MKEGLTVTGLTTAACLWVVAGVGLAVGSGFHSGALMTTALVFVTLGSLSRLDDWVDHEKNIGLNIHTVDKPGQLMEISALVLRICSCERCGESKSRLMKMRWRPMVIS